MTEWQPIGTAPKDGSEILVALGYHSRYDKEDYAFRIVSWDAEVNGWYDEVEDGCYTYPGFPGLWMPLPAPPNSP
jgi:hypothetical protein